MSAEVLRRAAALMRERAEAATPGPWQCYGDHLVWPSDQGPAANDPVLAMVGEAHEDSAEHIASWHPDVALAVADWLTFIYDAHLADNPVIPSTVQAHAITVARAYLGESA